VTDGVTAAEVRAGPVRRSVAGRATWLALGLLPLAAWLVLAILASGYNPPQRLTGDALFDKYCQAITPRQLAAGISLGLGGLHSRFLADSELAAWEGEFGNDPRFWMLRYHCTAQPGDEYDSGFSEEGIQDRLRYLEAARRRGVVDGAVLLNLLRRYESDWSSATAQDVSVPPPGRNADPTEYVRAQLAAVDARFGEEEAQLLDELLAAAPDQARPHYYAALYATQRSDYDRAFEELARGNRAPHNSALWGFPYDELLTRMRTGGKLPDKVSGGAVSLSIFMLPLPDFVSFKRGTIMLIDDAVARQDAAALAEIHTFACRFGDAEGNQTIGALVGLVMLRKVWEAAYNNWPQPLSADQQKALNELHQELDKLKSEIRRAGSNSNWPFNVPGIPGTAPMKATDAVQLLLSSWRSLNVTLLEALSDETLAEQQALGGQCHQLFKKIESFDYTTFSWGK